MHVIHVRNVNGALNAGLELMQEHGVRGESRNGDVIVASAPVTTVYERPWERVLFSPSRDANPFFHLYECLWMLAGRDDVRGVAQYVKRMRTYSDDGRTLHGAYGKRWRGWFASDPPDYPLDQIKWAIARLRKDPSDRRVVIGMWDPSVDAHKADDGGKDVPCNTHIYVGRQTDGRLGLTVCCRSNDMIWGAYGANAVHFSFLHEYLAQAVGMEQGRMVQVSNNFHAYLEPMEKILGHEHEDLYSTTDIGEQLPVPVISTSAQEFYEDLLMMMDENVSIGLRNVWLRRVAHPALMAHKAYSDKADEERHTKALEICEHIVSMDWRVACKMWLLRRHEESLRARDDGVTYE